MIGGYSFCSEIVKRTAYFIFIFGALITIPAFATGDGAEHFIKENLGGIDRKIIHIHEEIAETFAILNYILGGISIFGLWANWKQKTYSKYISIVVLIFSIVIIFFGRKTGTTGREILHKEIRSDFNIIENNE